MSADRKCENCENVWPERYGQQCPRCGHSLAPARGSANALQAATEAWVKAVQKYYEHEPNRNELTQVFMRGYFAGWSEREVAQLADKLADNANRLPSWPNHFRPATGCRRRGIESPPTIQITTEKIELGTGSRLVCAALFAF